MSLSVYVQDPSGSNQECSINIAEHCCNNSRDGLEDLRGSSSLSWVLDVANGRPFVLHDSSLVLQNEHTSPWTETLLLAVTCPVN